MSFFIKHTVNCGLYFCEDDYGLLFDGIHTGDVPGFSKTSEETVNIIINENKSFSDYPSNTDFIFTHLHTDHFNEELLNKILKYKVDYNVYSPSQKISTFDLSKKYEKLQFNNFTVYPITTIHDGKFDSEPHKSFLLTHENKSYFIAGDGILNEDIATELMKIYKDKISFMFINPYHLISQNGQKFLTILNPEKIYIYHLPFVEDDKNNFYKLVTSVAEKKYPNFVKPEILLPSTVIKESAHNSCD